MIQLFHRMISAALGISEKQIGHTLDLLEDGATIPSSVATAKKLPADWMKCKLKPSKHTMRS